MATTRIHDLAAEFGIPSEQLMGMLKELDIFVRSHLTPLKDEQVALMRARWEREKRKQKEPATPAKRRRAVKAVVEPTPAPVAEARPKRRRRTAAEVAAADEAAALVAAAEAAEADKARQALEAAAREQEEERPAASLEERAAALFKDLAPAESTQAAVEAPPAAATSGSPLPMPPRPFIPTPVRPRPVASATPSGPVPAPPRPVASAAPGALPLDERRREKGKKRKKGKKSLVDQEAVAQNISRTLATLKGPVGKKGVHRREEGPSFREVQEEKRREEKEREKTLVRVTEFITVSELANILKVPPTQIVTFAFKELGQMVTINQRLDFDMIELIASAFGFQAAREEEYALEKGAGEAADAAETLKARPPVVTIMGHVDHGKTSLLDYVRKTNVVAGEAGGITQHIGAYQVTLKDGRQITFLDTPGHEAFTAMRARGAQVTDIVVLVVAADDRVMPQTIEAIDHAKAANVPIVVAINKVDLPTADPNRIKTELAGHGVIVEQFGGKYVSVEISAKKGTNIEKLLEMLLLSTELLELKADPDRRAKGVVLEARVEQGRGVVASVLVQGGTLRVGDPFVAGQVYGRVRAMYDERRRNVKEAPPSTPVEVVGWSGTPSAGDLFVSPEDEREAREVASKRAAMHREHEFRSTKAISLTTFHDSLGKGGPNELKMLIKGDVDGSVEALSESLQKLSTGEVAVRVIRSAVGQISESDVLLAAASDAIIVGFHVRPDARAREMAEREKVEIRLYDIIYKAQEDVKLALEGMLKPELKEVVLGTAEVRQVFRLSKGVIVAGCMVASGKITRGEKVRLVRGDETIWTGRIEALKRFKDDVREVEKGFECGITLDGFSELQEGDKLESFKIEELARTL